jgi:hypothetical protein
MLQRMACEALNKRVCLSLNYGHYSRVVEVHTVGINDLDHPIISVWQVSGGSESNERTGWKTLLLSEATSVALTDIRSEAPRKGYRRDAKQFMVISGQI